jgi:hypothetical protein
MIYCIGSRCRRVAVLNRQVCKIVGEHIVIFPDIQTYRHFPNIRKFFWTYRDLLTSSVIFVNLVKCLLYSEALNWFPLTISTLSPPPPPPSSYAPECRSRDVYLSLQIWASLECECCFFNSWSLCSTMLCEYEWRLDEWWVALWLRLWRLSVHSESFFECEWAFRIQA